MIIFAIFGVIVNLVAAYVTRDGHSLNQKAVNLHMLEDVLGWIVVLIGAIVIKFTKVTIIDPIMSIAVAIFILVNAVKPFEKIINLFLIKIPDGIDFNEIKDRIAKIENVKDIHHIHIWSMDGVNNYATMHVVADVENAEAIKLLVKKELEKCGIIHATIEVEEKKCDQVKCHVEQIEHTCCHHHHH
jgi:cobalt-zinc-cadmium efflux system protein